jgi:DMSO/TMAO reductase YedYZ molybdopterin-dependent catalytic subunit
MKLPSTAHMPRPWHINDAHQWSGQGEGWARGIRWQSSAERPAPGGCGRPGSMPQLPPGQRKADGFPRFGGPFKPPTVPANPALQITGAVHEPVTVALSELSTLPRTEQMSDFHCVAGWSATGLRWEGVGFTTFYRSIIEPQLSPTAAATHVVFRSLDGYRAIVSIEDALQNDVLLADRLNDEPLSLAHGAPLRLVSPQQYGYLNAKHLCAIEVHTSAPPIPLDFVLFRQHPRARVWQEERNGLLPAPVVRPVYRALIRPFIRLSARGNWN